MAPIQKVTSDTTYDLESGWDLDSNGKSAQSIEPASEPAEDDIERRVYYIRGKSQGERVVATIRARNRQRAIEIATDNGIRVDRKDLSND